MNSNFIVLNRKFMNWEWRASPNVVSVFLHCLLSANYKDTRFQGYAIPRGSFVISQENFAQKCGLTRQQIRTCLKKLERTGEISIKSTNKFTMITVCNYCKYQDYQPTDNQQITNNQPTDNQQITIRETKKQEYINSPQGEYKCACTRTREDGENTKRACRFENSEFYADDLPESFAKEAEKQGFGNVAASEYQAFRDYWSAKAGKDAAKLDWLATWRNWLRRSDRFKGHSPPLKKTFDDILVANIEAGRKFLEAENG